MEKRAALLWKLAGWGIGGVLFLIGLAGIPGDVQQWQVWITDVMQVIDHNTARWVFAICGVLVIAAASIGPRRWEEWFHAVLNRWPWAKQHWEQWHQASPATIPATISNAAVAASPSVDETKTEGLKNQLFAAKMAHQDAAEQRLRLDRELQACECDDQNA